MINVLFVHSSSELYGSDRSLLNIVKGINKAKYNVYVMLPCQGLLADEIRKITNVKVIIFEVAVLRRKNLSIAGMKSYFMNVYKSVEFIKRFIRKNDINIVDTNTAVVFPGAIAAKQCHVKSVWHVREIVKSKVENWVISHVMQRYSDIIIANSKATAEALLVNRHIVRVVYNAVDDDVSHEHSSHEILTVGMAGRINRWKGQKLFVDMAEIIHAKYPEVQFQIAGDVYEGENFLMEELKAYIADKSLQDVVILLGQVGDMGAFYSGVDVFVLPSIQPEPFGLVVIEAMAHGIPVVATKHGGPVEIISDGIDGFLVNYRDAQEMAKRVEELLISEDMRNKMGENGKIKKERQFSTASMVKNIENIFNEVMLMYD